MILTVLLNQIKNLSKCRRNGYNCKWNCVLIWSHPCQVNWLKIFINKCWKYMAKFGNPMFWIKLRLATSDDLISNILSDHYFESMILLKYEFGWEWEDVLFFVTNQRSNPKELSQGWFSNLIWLKWWLIIETSIWKPF